MTTAASTVPTAQPLFVQVVTSVYWLSLNHAPRNGKLLAGAPSARNATPLPSAPSSSDAITRRPHAATGGPGSPCCTDGHAPGVSTCAPPATVMGQSWQTATSAGADSPG